MNSKSSSELLLEILNNEKQNIQTTLNGNNSDKKKDELEERLKLIDKEIDRVQLNIGNGILDNGLSKIDSKIDDYRSEINNYETEIKEREELLKNKLSHRRTRIQRIEIKKLEKKISKLKKNIIKAQNKQRKCINRKYISQSKKRIKIAKQMARYNLIRDKKNVKIYNFTQRRGLTSIDGIELPRRIKRLQSKEGKVAGRIKRLYQSSRFFKFRSELICIDDILTEEERSNIKSDEEISKLESFDDVYYYWNYIYELSNKYPQVSYFFNYQLELIKNRDEELRKQEISALKDILTNEELSNIKSDEEISNLEDIKQVYDYRKNILWLRKKYAKNVECFFDCQLNLIDERDRELRNEILTSIGLDYSNSIMTTDEILKINNRDVLYQYGEFIEQLKKYSRYKNDRNVQMFFGEQIYYINQRIVFLESQYFFDGNHTHNTHK